MGTPPPIQGTPLKDHLSEYPNERDLENWFTYHPPVDNQPTKYQAVREAGKFMAKVILHNCPGGPDRTHAIRMVRIAVMEANAAIACGEGKDGK